MSATSKVVYRLLTDYIESKMISDSEGETHHDEGCNKRLATYSGSAAASLGLFKTRVAALLALAAVFLASAAAKRSLTDIVRGWGRPNCQMCTFTSNKELPVPSEPL